MSSFQRARESLGLRLRELRRDSRLTGRQLAAAHGWHPSKVSKIEGGKQTPSEDDISAWARACGRPELVGELLASLRILEGQYVEFRRMFRAGQRATQEAIAEIEGETTFFAISRASSFPACCRHRSTPGTGWPRACRKSARPMM